MDIKTKVILYKLFNKKLCKYIICLLFVMLPIFSLSTYFYLQLNNYTTSVLEKSSLFPIANYDYFTQEPSIYVVNTKYEVVPAYFRTDFASIPQLFWFIEAPYKASFVYASIWHDYSYVCPKKRSRKEIDDIFYSLLRSEGNSFYTAFKMYLGVRIFGWAYFNNHELCDELLVDIVRDN